MSGCHEEISCNTELSTPHPAVLYCNLYAGPNHAIDGFNVTVQLFPIYFNLWKETGPGHGVSRSLSTFHELLGGGRGLPLYQL